MELSKSDSKMTKGLAILFMVMLHLFCQKENLPYTPLINIGSVPLIYYFGLFGDCCVVIYCFCSGYAHALMRQSKGKSYYPSVMKRLLVFLINFWIILIIFSVIGLIIGSKDIPVSFTAFIQTFSLCCIQYNGAWWFVLTYALLCALSPLILKIVNMSTVLSVLLFLGIYLISYMVRFGKANLPFPDILCVQLDLARLGTSLLPYAIGIVFYKHKVFTFLSKQFSRLRPWLGNLLLAGFFAAMFIAHAVVQTLFVAIFTGIGTIICFNLWKKPKFFTKAFEFFGNQSTNIWLTHMFFYMVLFKDLVFVAKYPLLVLALMLVITTAVSLIINQIMKLLRKTVLKKLT